MNCPHCFYSISEGLKYCLNCGYEFITYNSSIQEHDSFFSRFADRVDKMPKSHRSVEPKLYNIFSRVFRRHSDIEAERLFIVGTALTTPTIEEIVDTWPKPWLFARIFIIALVGFLGLYLGVNMFGNINFIPGLIIVGAFGVPFTILVFFWEMNAPQNIAIYKIVYVVFMGGILSLLVALVFYDILRNNINPITTGIVEELSKVVAVIWFVRNLKYRYVLNGLLLGAAIGVGFAAFETAGYALRALLSGSFHSLYSTILWRSVFSPGGHVAWAALTGAAICIVQEDSRFQVSMLLKRTFLIFFAIVVSMHALWDAPFMGIFPYGQVILMVISWILVIYMIRVGLKQIGHQKRQISNQSYEPSPS